MVACISQISSILVRIGKVEGRAGVDLPVLDKRCFVILYAGGGRRVFTYGVALLAGFGFYRCLCASHDEIRLAADAITGLG